MLGMTAIDKLYNLVYNSYTSPIKDAATGAEMKEAEEETWMRNWLKYAATVNKTVEKRGTCTK